jgi:hypothetical protein
MMFGSLPGGTKDRLDGRPGPKPGSDPEESCPATWWIFIRLTRTFSDLKRSRLCLRKKRLVRSPGNVRNREKRPGRPMERHYDRHPPYGRNRHPQRTRKNPFEAECMPGCGMPSRKGCRRRRDAPRPGGRSPLAARPRLREGRKANLRVRVLAGRSGLPRIGLTGGRTPRKKILPPIRIGEGRTA